MNPTATTPGRPSWTAGPLYRLMLDIFPERRTPTGVLDIKYLSDSLGRSHEAVYMWFRAGHLRPSNARAIVALAAQTDNAAALVRAGREPPRYEDFLPHLN